MRIEALSVLAPVGTLVLDTEAGGPKFFNKHFKKKRRERKEGRKERGQKKAQRSTAK